MLAQIAVRLGLAASSVSDLEKKGMPITSVEEAVAWRIKNPPKRPNTRKSTLPAKPKASFVVTQGPTSIPAQPEPPPKRDRPIPKPPEPTGDSLLDSLNQSIYVANEAFRIVQEAMASDDADQLQIKLSIHTHAQQAANKAQIAYREERQERGQLIELNTAKAKFRKGFDFILKRFRALPQSKAPECNPENAALAFTVLENAINDIIGDAQKEYLPSEQGGANLHHPPQKELKRTLKPKPKPKKK